MKPNILIVDDEAGVRSALSGVLRDEDYLVEAVDSGEACLDLVTRDSFDVILLDVWLPGIDGIVTLTRLRERHVEAAVVMISGHGSIEAAVKAIKMGAFDFIEKPLSLDKTVLVVRNALRQRRLEAENIALRAHVDRRRTLVGESSVMRQLARAGGAGGAVERARADLRRERHRQGTGRAEHPRAQPAPGGTVRRGQLRGHPGGADRERAVRPRAGRVHRRGRPTGAASSRRPTAARSSSTKSPT